MWRDETWKECTSVSEYLEEQKARKTWFLKWVHFNPMWLQQIKQLSKGTEKATYPSMAVISQKGKKTKQTNMKLPWQRTKLGEKHREAASTTFVRVQRSLIQSSFVTPSQFFFPQLKTNKQTTKKTTPLLRASISILWWSSWMPPPLSCGEGGIHPARVAGSPRWHTERQTTVRMHAHDQFGVAT